MLKNVFSIPRFPKLLFVLLLGPLSLSAQTQTPVHFVDDLKEEARGQLQQILKQYPLDDWIFTQEIKVVHGEDARSYPILQINTNHLKDDKVQLSVFVHENAHVFVAGAEKDSAETMVIQKLKALFPDPPAPKQKNLYHHIMVVWIEYDALLELFGEKEAREIMKRKIDYYIKKAPDSPLAQNYKWYNGIAMDKAQEVGRLMDQYGFNINPDKGTVVR